MKVKAEALERDGKKLLHFEIGDNSDGPPARVQAAAIVSILKEQTHYTDPKGLYELREAIAKKYGCKIEEVCICPANFAIFGLLSILCNKGDKVDYPVPGFPTYKAVSKYLGLKRSKNAKIKIRCDYNNPDGMVQDWEFGKEFFTILDLAYINLNYVGARKLVINLDISAGVFSFSKDSNMPGFRMGYVISNKEVIDKLGLLIETTYSCMPEFSQRAALAALKLEPNKMRLFKKRNLMHKIVSKKYECELPKGGYYLWCKCKDGDKEFERLLKKGIVVCPGSIFGKKDHIRFCFARPTKDIKKLGNLL